MLDRHFGARTAAAFAVVLAFAVSSLAEDPPDGKDKIEVLTVRGDEVRCKIQKWDDDYIWIVQVVGDIEIEPVQLPWSAIDRTSAERIRGPEKRKSALEKLLAASSGDMVEAVRIRLKNGTVFVALEIKERSTDKEFVVRTKNIPEARYPRKDIESTEPLMLPMTEFYSLDELYQMRRDEKNPQTARDHVALAEEMMKIRCWQRAIEHYERAGILDPDFVESTKDRMAEARAAWVAESVDDLDRKIQLDIRAERWREALGRIEQLSEVDPNSSIRTRWDALREGIVANLQKDLRRQIVGSYYQLIADLVEKRTRSFVSDGEMPGVIVTTKNRGIQKGTLVSEDEEFVVVESNGEVIKIARSLVTDVKPVDLTPRTKLRYPTFTECKEYASDTSGGITADILRKLEERYKKYGTKDNPVTQETIKAFWDDRLTTVTEITERGVKRTGRIYSYHEAEYKTGTWLREGAAAAPAAGGMGGNAGEGQAGNAGGLEADPEKWWQTQLFEVRTGILRAIAAEALCIVESEVKIPCPACGGKGVSTQVRGLTSGQISQGVRVCSACRGIQYFMKIRYR